VPASHLKKNFFDVWNVDKCCDIAKGYDQTEGSSNHSSSQNQSDAFLNAIFKREKFTARPSLEMV